MVQIRSRNSPESGLNETLVLHCVDGEGGDPLFAEALSSREPLLPLSIHSVDGGEYMSDVLVQGYLDHKKQPPPLGPYNRIMPKALCWS